MVLINIFVSAEKVYKTTFQWNVTAKRTFWTVITKIRIGLIFPENQPEFLKNQWLHFIPQDISRKIVNCRNTRAYQVLLLVPGNPSMAGNVVLNCCPFNLFWYSTSSISIQVAEYLTSRFCSRNFQMYSKIQRRLFRERFTLEILWTKQVRKCKLWYFSWESNLQFSKKLTAFHLWRCQSTVFNWQKIGCLPNKVLINMQRKLEGQN